MFKKNNPFSFYSILLIGFSIVVIFFAFNLWKKNRIVVDVPSYYSYLPAFVIHHDLKLNFIDNLIFTISAESRRESCTRQADLVDDLTHL